MDPMSNVVPPGQQTNEQMANQVIKDVQSGGLSTKLKEKLNPKMIRLLNILACVFLLIGAIFRMVECFKAFNLFFFITSLYFFVFIIFVAAVEIQEEHKVSIFIRTYFNFLDQMFGRGVFLIYLSFMLLERKTALEIIFCILILIIAIIDVTLGYGDAKRKLASLPWEVPTSMQGQNGDVKHQENQPPASGA